MDCEAPDTRWWVGDIVWEAKVWKEFFLVGTGSVGLGRTPVVSHARVHGGRTGAGGVSPTGYPSVDLDRIH